MRTYLFDLDGTLLDSIGLILTSFHHTSREHLQRELPDSYWLEGTGTPLRDQLAKVARSKEELSAMLDTYVAYNLSQHDEMAKSYPGMVDVVRTLHARRAKLALVTSKMSRGAARGLRLLGLEEELSVRVCADDVEHGKPDPAPVSWPWAPSVHRRTRRSSSATHITISKREGVPGNDSGRDLGPVCTRKAGRRETRSLARRAPGYLRVMTTLTRCTSPLAPSFE